LIGSFCLTIGSKLERAVRTLSLDSWSAIGARLATTSTFQQEPFFYAVTEFQPSTTEKSDATEIATLSRSFKSSVDLRLTIYHKSFSPTISDGQRLTVSCGQSLTLTSPPSVDIDSNYNLNEWTLRSTGAAWTDTDTWIEVVPTSGSALSLRFAIGHQRWLTIGSIIVIAAFLPGPAALAALQASGGTLAKALVVYIVGLVISGIPVALVALLGLPRLRL